MGGGLSKMAQRELLATIRDRYRSSFKKDRAGSSTSSSRLPATTTSLASACWPDLSRLLVFW